MLIIQRPVIEAIGEEQNNTQKFAVGPLDPGFGHTLGNSLRRTLLSVHSRCRRRPRSSSTRVLHEFGVIEGVKEDVQRHLLEPEGHPSARRD
jgi:DNA-directed RNA polymerase subunit alpha